MRKCDFSLTFSHWHPSPPPGEGARDFPRAGWGWNGVSKVGREGPGKEGSLVGWVALVIHCVQGKANWQWRSGHARAHRATPKGDNPK